MTLRRTDEHGNPIPDPRILAVADKLEGFVSAFYGPQERASIARTLVEAADAQLVTLVSSPHARAFVENHARFDRDPAALAWARSRVDNLLEHARRRELRARGRGGIGDDQHASFWRRYRYLLAQHARGADCMVGVFDERLPGIDQVVAAAAELARA